MLSCLDVLKNDRGGYSLKAPPGRERELAEEIRSNEFRNLSPFAGLLILQARLEEVESICLTASIPTAKVKGDRSQPTAIKRTGRIDRLPFGWRLHPHDNKKLLPDREEQETIRRAQFLAAAGVSLREICRRLDQEGRGRRGKKWEGSHSILGTILLRNKQP
ncbi:MAG: recombinase family protein [Thermoguttaceae bacterium]